MPNNHVVIVGAGPIGLYTAIRLHQQGVKVTIIDPRLGEYTRPGITHDEVFETIKRGLGEELGKEIEHSYAFHIKDAERTLYKILKDLIEQDKQAGAGTTIEASRSKFLGFESGGIVVQPENTREKSFIECDFALDCTGTRRMLVGEINKRDSSDNPPFKIKKIGENPIPNHFLAYVKLDPAQAALIDNPSRPEPSSFEYISAMKELWDLGWPHTVEPVCFPHRLIDETEGAVDKGKVCFYYEVPPDLKVEDRERWLKAIIKINTGLDMDFEKILVSKKLSKERQKHHPALPEAEVKKPTFLPIPVMPDRIVSVYQEGAETIPTVVPMGDALVTPDYRLGEGIISGIERANILLDTLRVRAEGGIELNVEQYEKRLEKYMSVYERKIEKQQFDTEEMILQSMQDRGNYEKSIADLLSLNTDTMNAPEKSDHAKKLAQMQEALAMFDSKLKSELTFLGDYISSVVQTDRETGLIQKKSVTLLKRLDKYESACKELEVFLKESAQRGFPCDTAIVAELGRLQSMVSKLHDQVEELKSVKLKQSTSSTSQMSKTLHGEKATKVLTDSTNKLSITPSVSAKKTDAVTKSTSSLTTVEREQLSGENTDHSTAPKLK